MSLIADQRDQLFVLYEMLGIEDLLETEKYRDHSKDIYNMTLDLAVKLGNEEILPVLAKGDREGARFSDGSVTIPECYQALHKTLKESGFYTMHIAEEFGGQGLPSVIDAAAHEYSSFNLGFMLYPEAAVGAAGLIASYGSEAQQRTYMDKMMAGEWGGTMVLTEPGAGSDVGSLQTKAILQADGSYRIKGNKIFISGGDSDLFENIVHPVLARIEGDPEGTSGISIFLVPKYRVNEDGSLGERNDVHVTGIEDKMGLKGSATCAMSFGGDGECYAELLGEARSGMKIMFQMMNGARIAIGLQGLSTGSTAYLHALNYAKERVQGAELENMRDPSAKKVPIISHPDVRRMLLWMKTHVEGLRALVYFCAYAHDKSKAYSGDDARKWQGILDLLVPIVKAYGTDIGFKITEQAIQIHGGYGYTKDFPVEQFMRDMKIASIYEGTNGIQALDLVGRKLGQSGGKPFLDVLSMMKETVAKASSKPCLKALAEAFDQAVDRLVETATFFMECGQKGQMQHPVIKATPFMNLFGNIALAWFHLWQANIAVEWIEGVMGKGEFSLDDPKSTGSLLDSGEADAAFYLGKVTGASFYIRNVLPEAHALATTIQNKDMSVVTMPEASFGL